VSEPIFRSSSWVGAKGERLLSVRLATVAATDRKERDAPKPDLYSAAGERASFELLPVIRLRRKDQQASTHSPSGRSASSTDAFPRKVDGFLTHFAILCARKGKLGELSMATRQVKTVTKTAPAARSNPIRKTADKPKAAPAVLKLVTTKAANKERTATSSPKPASMTGPLPPIVTLKHLAEWAGYNHGIPKKQAIEMFTGFVADIGRVLKKGSKIRIPNLGVLQVRIRPARPARKGRNPATGEEIRIKASKASKKVAFRVAKGLREAI
jgi:DNA-binding protein HU-beta